MARGCSGAIWSVLGGVVAAQVLEWALWAPRRMDRALRAQGLRGTRYRLLWGDLREEQRLTAVARDTSVSMDRPHDIVPRVAPFLHHAIQEHGKLSFTWFGPTPRVIITDPEVAREVLVNKSGDFLKSSLTSLSKVLVGGLLVLDGEKWAKHRRILNPAFHAEKLKDDLLGLLLESNMNYSDSDGKSSKGITAEEVIGECKVFYFAGMETTGVLLTWTMVVLSMHPEWQDRAREEVLQVFGQSKPDFNGVARLKVVAMVLYEVLRLYPPAVAINRRTHQPTKLGDVTCPAGVMVTVPVMFLHRDPALRGSDAGEFNPRRFAEGVSKACSDPGAFVPFSWGPRVCIGQNFALLEAKLAVSMILQRFAFELSPAYVHAPYTVLTLHPQHGVPVMLRRL